MQRWQNFFLKDVETLSNFKHTTKLETVTLSGNPLFKNAEGYVHLLYFLPGVKSIDGVSIEMYAEDEEIDQNE